MPFIKSPAVLIISGGISIHFRDVITYYGKDSCSSLIVRKCMFTSPFQENFHKSIVSKYCDRQQQLNISMIVS